MIGFVSGEFLDGCGVDEEVVVVFIVVSFFFSFFLSPSDPSSELTLRGDPRGGGAPSSPRKSTSILCLMNKPS